MCCSSAAHADFSPEFFSFAQPSETRVEHPLHATFGDELELLGFNYVAPRDQELKLELFWRALKDAVSARDIKLYLLDTVGKPIGETRFTQPTLVWYPTTQWRVGQTRTRAGQHPHVVN